MSYPPLTEHDTYEGASDCGCKHTPPVLAEPMVAITVVEEALDLSPPIPPRTLRVEKAHQAKDGSFTFETMTEVGIAGASEARDCDGPKCLPWVRITRDPNRFRACLAQARKIGRIESSKKLYELVKDFMTAEDQEVFYVILLDTQLYVRGISELARGARDRVQTPVPDVLRLAIVDGATAFLVAHNHPSGRPNPSEADKDLTKAIVEAADAVGIGFFDHIIVGATSYYSFADNKLV